MSSTAWDDFNNGGGGSASPHADPGGGGAAYYRAVTASSPDIITPRVSHCTFWNVFELRFGLGPVKSLHIIISFDVFSVVKSILMFFCPCSTVFYPFYEVAVPVAGLDSLASLQDGRRSAASSPSPSRALGVP